MFFFYFHRFRSSFHPLYFDFVKTMLSQLLNLKNNHHDKFQISSPSSIKKSQFQHLLIFSFCKKSYIRTFTFGNYKTCHIFNFYYYQSVNKPYGICQILSFYYYQFVNNPAINRKNVFRSFHTLKFQIHW